MNVSKNNQKSTTLPVILVHCEILILEKEEVSTMVFWTFESNAFHLTCSLPKPLISHSATSYTFCRNAELGYCIFRY
jgi:hypothetical protein